jgi:hypothetical protein
MDAEQAIQSHQQIYQYTGVDPAVGRQRLGGIGTGTVTEMLDLWHEKSWRIRQGHHIADRHDEFARLTIVSVAVLNIGGNFQSMSCYQCLLLTKVRKKNDNTEFGDVIRLNTNMIELL